LTSHSSFLILGCGYTGKLVAQALSSAGFDLTCTTRKAGSTAGLRCLELDATKAESVARLLPAVENGVRVLCSIPAVELVGEFLDVIRSWRPQRMVYLSTTGVYGPAELVDELTPPNAQDGRAELRLRTERRVADGPWPTLVLRPAAIYGPDRGVHVSVLQDDYSRAGGWNRVVSRIHVQDLADHAIAALQSDIEGQFPVADEEPCRSLEVAEFAAALLGKRLPALSFDTSGSGRRVNGSAVRERLGVSLRFPSYREGVAAALRRQLAT
jgi:nucleoside-diphosphate-sugar epimerase